MGIVIGKIRQNYCQGPAVIESESKASDQSDLKTPQCCVEL